MKKSVPLVVNPLLSASSLISFTRACMVYAMLLLGFLLSSTNTSAQTVVVDPASPWVVPAGVVSVKVEVWGGGGGGGQAWIGSGGGGGGGAYATTVFAVTAGQSYTITKGAGGGSDANGGNSVVSGPAGSVTAAGGSAGTLNYFGIGGDGGAGGAGTRNGGNGATEGAGGGGAGNSGSGANTTTTTGGAGGAGLPNVYPYAGGNGGNFNANGAAPGGGGGGGFSNSFFSIDDGGSGGAGRVVLTYTTGPVAPAVSAFTSPACTGQTISITGANFTNASTVTFAPGITVAATYISSTNITAVLPAGATGNFTVTTAGGTSAAAGPVVIHNLTTALNVTGAGSFCGSTAIAATGGSGGNIYFQGTNASGTSTAQTSPQTVSTVGTNTYYFRENNACGWGAAYPVTVTINPLPASFSVSVAAGCSSALLTPSGASGDVFYFQGTTTNGTSTASPGAQTVLSPGTYYYRARTAAGCWGPDVPVNVVFTVTASFTSQPSSQTICIGSNASFTAAATSGSALSYRWYAGNTALVNTGNVSGTTTQTLTITGATAANAAADYNCRVTDACGTIISSYVSLTVNTPAVAPTTAATALTFPGIGVTSISGSFTASTTATNYMVVRSNSAAALSPANGTTYVVGAATFGANTYIEYVGPNTSFVSSGLNQNTTYYYHVFPFNINNCSGTDYPYYRTPALIGSVTTATSTTCPSRSTLYWAGTGTTLPSGSSGSTAQKRDFNRAANWSTSGSSYSVATNAPTRCNDVVISLNADVTIQLSAATEFFDLTFQVSGNNDNGVLSNNGFNMTVWGNAILSIPSGNSSTSVSIGELGSTAATSIDFKANLTMGASGASTGSANLIGNQNSKIIVRGDLQMNRIFALSATSINTTLPGTLELDGNGVQQLRWYNDLYSGNFRNVVIGNTNNPRVVMGPGSQTPDNIRGNLTINGSSILDLSNSQWNRIADGGTFTMNGNSSLLLGGAASVANGSTATLVAGSNYPSGFTSVLNGTSSIEYNAAHSITQTVNAVPAYRNIIFTRGSGSSAANKTIASAISFSGTAIINNGATVSLNAGITNNGTFTIASGGILVAGTQVVSGSGAFNLNSGATISTANVNGITASGAAGSIQSTGLRSYHTGASYIYNGTTLQQTGNGLPATVENLTINNSNDVNMNGATGTYTVSNTLYQVAGMLKLNGNTFTVNTISRNSGTFAGSHTASLVVNGTNVPLFFNTATAAGSTLKNISINSNKSAYLGTALDITAGLSAGNAGKLTIASSAVLTTNDNLTLRSNQFGTAAVAEIPVNGSGVALGSVTGKVTIERYLSNNKAWRFLAAPVKTGATSPSFAASWGENNITPNTYGTRLTGPSGTGLEYSPGYSVKWWNAAANNWVMVNNATAAIANKEGYMIYVRGDRTITPTSTSSTATNLRIKGELVTGTQSYSVGAGKFISVGNPYASAIKASDVINAGGGNFQGAYYAWDPSINGSYYVGGYQTLSFVDGFEALVGGSNLYPAGSLHPTIQSGQAFFLNNMGTSTVNFNITESMKAGGSTTVSRENTINDREFIRVKLYTADNTIADGNLVAFDDEFSNTIDADDAVKFANGGENFGILRNSKKLAIEARARIITADTIFYDMSNIKVAAYTLQVMPRNIQNPLLSAFLVDRFLNTQTPISLTDTSYINFAGTADAASRAAGRFMMVFKQTTVLPVTIVAVSATRNSDRSIAISWKVENELNMLKYEVERSKDGANFTGISGTAPSAPNGGSAVYLQNDLSPLAADNFYRIKAISINGQVQYSAIVKVSAVSVVPSISVYPNPVENKTMNIVFAGQQKGKYQAELISVNGQVVYSNTFTLHQSNITEQVQLDALLPTGMYQLRISGNDGVTTQPVLVK